MKVNVWQVGYTTCKDYHLNAASNAECREKGYVTIDSDDLGWEEEVWDLLNWSCWTSDKPEAVHSPLDHCNADVILQIEGTQVYRCALSAGWDTANSLNGAIQIIKKSPWNLWPFSDVKRKPGYYKTGWDGKVYWSKDRKTWEEVTW